MHVVPIRIILERTALPSHGQLEAVGGISEPQGADVVHLVSHQWLGFAVPDACRVPVPRELYIYINMCIYTNMRLLCKDYM